MSKTIKNQSIQKNFIYQFLYQVIILFIPLIISPYLTRVLGDKALGTYSYINSIAYYFVILSNLGIAKYGQRIIAKNSDDEVKTRRIFWSLFALHTIVSIFCIILYIIYILIFVKSDEKIYFIECLYLISALFDITWLFYGLENFKSVVIKNGIIKVIECILIILLVKSSNDLDVYVIIVSSSLLLGQIVMFFQAIYLIKPIKFNVYDMLVHIKPLFIFSISVIAVSLYTVFDKTLLGILSTKENVAYYEYANKIISLPRTFITIIGTVMLPKACKMVKHNDTFDQQKYLKISLLFVSFIGNASMFGLLAVSKQLSIVYYGSMFIESGNIMMATCMLPLIVGLGDVVRTQYMIPNEMDKQYTICIIINAIINLILSGVLIPYFGVYGAVIGTIAAELFGCIYQLIICRKFINIKIVIKALIPFFVIGLIMFCIISAIKIPLGCGVLSLLIQICVGIIVFSILSIMYFYFFEKNIWFLFISKFKKIKH